MPEPQKNPSSTVKFEVYPAIDIYQGHCVRLLKGDYNRLTEYHESPLEVAQGFVAAGAHWIHAVDLDAANTGGSENRGVIAELAAYCRGAGVCLQVGGGIRSGDAIASLLQLGVTRCILGTAARDTNWVASQVRRFGSSCIIAGLDGRDGKLAVQGWREQTGVSLVELSRRLAAVGLERALVTDVNQDGTLTGPNLTLASEIQQASGMAVIASGGVGSTGHVLAAQTAGLAGAIVGRALYDGRIQLADLLRQIREGEAC